MCLAVEIVCVVDLIVSGLKLGQKLVNACQSWSLYPKRESVPQCTPMGYNVPRIGGWV